MQRQFDLEGYVVVTGEVLAAFAEMPKITFDLDGVLNIPEVPEDRRWQYPQEMANEKPTAIVEALKLLMTMPINAYPIIVTNREARPDMAQATVDWLMEQAGLTSLPCIVMREAGLDHEQGLKLKARTIAALDGILHIDDKLGVIHALHQEHDIAGYHFDSRNGEMLANHKAHCHGFLAAVNENLGVWCERQLM